MYNGKLLQSKAKTALGRFTFSGCLHQPRRNLRHRSPPKKSSAGGITITTSYYSASLVRGILILFHILPKVRELHRAIFSAPLTFKLIRGYLNWYQDSAYTGMDSLLLSPVASFPYRASLASSTQQPSMHTRYRSALSRDFSILTTASLSYLFPTIIVLCLES